jgi:hypothetical protein
MSDEPKKRSRKWLGIGWALIAVAAAALLSHWFRVSSAPVGSTSKRKSHDRGPDQMLRQIAPI